MATTGNITFFIQRHEDSRGRSKDDVVNISPAENGLYNVTYRSEVDSHIGNRRMVLSEFDTLRYVQTMLDMLSLDSEPFSCVQIALPAMPSTLYRINQLSDTGLRNNIFSAMKITMRSWPTRKSATPRTRRVDSDELPAPPPLTRTHSVRPYDTYGYATPQNAIPSSESEYAARRDSIRQHLRFD